MDFSSWLWIAFILFALQPLVAQRVQKTMRAQKLMRLQKARGARIIAIIHRQEAMRLFGFPIARYIDMEDAEEVLQAIRETEPDEAIDVILHTPGGIAIAALQIARALIAHPGPVTIFVPHFAMSGGTLIALAADKIVMSEHAVLGPIDPQVNGMPAASIIRVKSEKSLNRIDDETLIYADVAAKAIDQLKRATVELLSGHMDAEAANKVADELTSGRWTHDYPITAGEARAFGLAVSTDMPKDVLDLLQLYPRAMRQQPGVESGPYREPLPRNPAGLR